MNSELRPEDPGAASENGGGPAWLLVPILLFVVGGFFALIWSGPSQDAGPADGPALYQVTCARCHGERGEGVPPYKPLRGTPWTLEEIETRIREGKGAMPPFSYLSPEKRRAIAAHVKSLVGE